MGWNIGLAVIESDVAATIADELELDPPSETVSFEIATGYECRDKYYGVGTLDRFTLVTVPFPPDRGAWKRLSKQGRVVAFWLTENMESNCLYIYENGKQVVKREDGQKAAWKPKHALEKGAKGHRADYIRAVFKNLTGHDLIGERMFEVSVALHEERAKAIDPAKLDELRARLDDAIAKPFPDPSDSFAGFKWLNRRNAIVDSLDDAWSIDPGIARDWFVMALADMERWPDEERTLSPPRFEAISDGKDNGRAEVFAPLYRTLKISSSIRFKPKSFARFCAHPVANALSRVDFGCAHLPTEAAVLAGGSFANVEYLSFDRDPIGDAGVEALARAAFPKLRHLNLYACDMTTFTSLAEAPFAPALVSLEIGGNNVGDHALGTLGRFANLRYLSVRVDKTFDAAAVRRALAQLPALETLVLSETAIADGEIARPGLTVHTAWVPIL